MNKLQISVASVLAVAFAGAAQAQFVNGNFENGTASGWTTGTGYRGNNLNPLNPTAFLPGGSLYNASLSHSAVVGQGVMAHTDGNLNQVYSGNYSYRIEDLTTGGYASVISQTVKNYQSTDIFFAWAATLEGAHGQSDAATFQLLLRDLTSGIDLISRSYNAASGASGVDSRFALSTDNFYYTKTWQVEQLSNLTIGHDYALTLLAADCQPTGHQGTVYLDGFGAVTPPPVDPGSNVPEPASWAMMVGGFGLVGGAMRRRKVSARFA